MPYDAVNKWLLSSKEDIIIESVTNSVEIVFELF